MSISSINSSQNLHRNFQQLASGKRINKAADDPAGLAIAQKLLKQAKGYQMANRNAGTAKDMTNVAEGGLGSITDSLQRIRELSVQASNTAVYGDTERGAMQQEIEQLKNTITDVASNTQFNTMNLLDGSKGSFHIATNPDGSGMDINMPTSTLQALGIADYDVTGSFDLDAIDRALDQVTSGRSNLGSVSNRLDYSISNNSYASYQTTSAQSKIEDLDFPKAVSELKKNEVLEDYRMMMQKKQEDENGKFVRLLKFNS